MVSAVEEFNFLKSFPAAYTTSKQRNGSLKSIMPWKQYDFGPLVIDNQTNNVRQPQN
jgi:hypothetical protein